MKKAVKKLQIIHHGIHFEDNERGQDVLLHALQKTQQWDQDDDLTISG